ncbi:TPA: AlpA family transcriptional regulator [Aeromonas hydrophila]|nr:AlpA family transcriptional regulator [Aeromonas hydrophila]
MSKFHRLKAVIEITGLSRTTIYRLAAAGQFPQAVKLGPRAVGWPSDQIEQWVAQRIPA